MSAATAQKISPFAPPATFGVSQPQVQVPKVAVPTNPYAPPAQSSVGGQAPIQAGDIKVAGAGSSSGGQGVVPPANVVPAPSAAPAGPPLPGTIVWERSNLIFWIVWVLIIFFVVIGILFFLQVSIVTDVDTAGNVTINSQKLFLWGLLITILLLLLFWLLSKTGCYSAWIKYA